VLNFKESHAYVKKTSCGEGSTAIMGGIFKSGRRSSLNKKNENVISMHLFHQVGTGVGGSNRNT
jgi:hypothetical protein